jgi:hypothetical protein
MKRSALAFVLFVSACGGSGAALQAAAYPGDTRVTPRRLEGLAREFENIAPCTAADTIDISGMAPQVYHVEGCGSAADYALECRPRASGGYGPSETCSWRMFSDVTVLAASAFGCSRETIDARPVGANAREVTGCGYRAVYTLQCAPGGCQWILTGRIEGTATSGGNGGGYAY